MGKGNMTGVKEGWRTGKTLCLEEGMTEVKERCRWGMDEGVEW